MFKLHSYWFVNMQQVKIDDIESDGLSLREVVKEDGSMMCMEVDDEEKGGLQVANGTMISMEE